MINQKHKKIENSNQIFAIILAVYFLSLPFGALNLGSFGSLLRYIGLVVVLVWAVLCRKIYLSKIILIELLFLFFVVLSTIYSINVESSFNANITNIFYVILLLSVSGLAKNEFNTNILRKSLIWSSRLTVIFVFVFGDFYEGSNRISLGNIFIEDPNYLTGYFLFGYVFAFYKMMDSKKYKTKLLSFCEIIIYIFIVLATGSRTGFIMYVFITIGMIIFSGNTRLKNLITLSLIIAIYFMIVQTATIFIDNDVLYRFTIESIIESQGTGRFGLWKNAIDIFLDSNLFRMIFGYGAGTMTLIYSRHGYREAAAHNKFLQILLENGLLGFITYSVLIFKLIFTSIKFKDKEIFFILLGMIILSFAASLTAYKPYWNVIFMIVYFEKAKKKLKANDKENSIEHGLEKKYN